jgi:tetratricopeptide (TPR) repeat protein
MRWLWLAALGVVVALGVLRRRSRAAAPRLQRPGDTDLFQKMERLGIPVEGGRGDTHLAGDAKTRLYQHVRALEAERWEEAVDGLSGTIELLAKQADARWGDVLGVAYRLRARAHEGAGRRTDALADYERALAFLPEDAESREGKARMSNG